MDFAYSYSLHIFIPVLAVLLITLISAVKALSNNYRKKKKKLPPIATTIFHQLLNFRRLNDHTTQIFHEHKTYRMLTPFRHHMFFTTNPANVEYILKTNFNNYGKGSFNYGNTTDLFGDGIFAVDGEKWHHQRKLASYEFSTKVLRDFSSVIFRRNAAKLAQILSIKAFSHEAVDIQELFMRSTMDSIFKVGFGVELNTLEGSEEGKRFTKAFDDASEAIAFRYVNVFWKIQKFLRFGYEAKLSDDLKIVDSFVYKLIDAEMRPTSDRKNNSEKKEDLLSRFLSEMEKDPENRSRKYLRDIILNFLIAGKDTTAGALSWFIYMLCKHPQIQEKVAREVKEATESVNFADCSNIENFPTHLSEEALDKMQYLHAALTETLRLYPSVPVDMKICFSDDTLPDGFSIRKGTLVIYYPYAMGRMKYIWGEDAETFRPERWINADGFFQPESPFKFTAFQAGPRICLGKEFAYRQMKIFAAFLLRYFEFKLVHESKKVNYRPMLTLHISEGLHVHVFNR